MERQMRFLVLGITLLLFLFPLVNSIDVGVANSDGKAGGIFIVADEDDSVNNNTLAVNRTDYWDNLDTPLDINSMGSFTAGQINVSDGMVIDNHKFLYWKDSFGLAGWVMFLNNANQLNFRSLQGGDINFQNTANSATLLKISDSGNDVTIGEDLEVTGKSRLLQDTTIDNKIDIHSNGGNFNTYIGEDAGKLVTGSATQNTIIGAYSGDALTNGVQNTFIGTSSGGAVNTGSINTFVGQGAGSMVTTQGSLTYLGAFAGRYQTGANNYCSGAYACEGFNGQSTGNNNFFLGGNAGQQLTSGSQNTGIGAGALLRVLYGDDNVCFGTSCMAFSQGDNNIAFGRQSGIYYNGTGSMFFGKGIGWSKDLPDNILMIDNEAGLNDTLIFGNFEGNNLTINGDLEVTGNITGDFYFAEGWGTHIGEVQIASSGVYYNITNFTQGEVNGFTFSADGGITPINSAVAGLYKVDGHWSFSGSASQEYHIGVSKNDVMQDNCHTERVIGSGGDVGSASITCFIRITTSDHLNAQIENVDSAGNPTIHDVNFNMIRIGD